MSYTEFIIALVTAVVGSSGLSAIITTILSARKFRSEADRVQEETQSLRVQNEIAGIDYINKKLQEITEQSNQQSNVLRARNDELNDRITELNFKLQAIMSWIMEDNQQYRLWLETRLKELDPDIEFPHCSAPPNVFGHDYDHNNEPQS